MPHHEQFRSSQENAQKAKEVIPKDNASVNTNESVDWKEQLEDVRMKYKAENVTIKSSYSSGDNCDLIEIVDENDNSISTIKFHGTGEQLQKTLENANEIRKQAMLENKDADYLSDKIVEYVQSIEKNNFPSEGQ